MDFDIATYNAQKYPWYSPHFVIRAMSLLTKLYGANVEDKREFQLAREMFDSAAALLGVYELHNDNKYFLQPNLQSASPDVVAAKNTEMVDAPVVLEETNLELVRMNEYAGTDDVVEFLKRTKLSSKKSYDNKTLILCVISKKIQINIQKIADSLREINPKPKSTIYILGILQGDKDRWTIFSPYPDLVPPVIYSLAETIKKYQLPGSVTMHRGSVKKITYEKMDKQLTTTVYEVFNIDEYQVQKYKIVRGTR
ncbi:MAG TPA: hypothetical protein VMR81_07755 [Patescibacteria group bacterium]|nr:hypothetical protein [Patescibacteria group bacterium]